MSEISAEEQEKANKLVAAWLGDDEKGRIAAAGDVASSLRLLAAARTICVTEYVDQVFLDDDELVEAMARARAVACGNDPDCEDPFHIGLPGESFPVWRHFEGWVRADLDGIRSFLTGLKNRSYKAAKAEGRESEHEGRECVPALSQADPSVANAEAAAVDGSEVAAPVPLTPTSNGEGPHPDDLAVDRFAAAMKAKLAYSRQIKGRGGWDGPDCSQALLSRLLRGHVDKGDPVDVANFAMMLHQRGEAIAPGHD